MHFLLYMSSLFIACCHHKQTISLMLKSCRLFSIKCHTSQSNKLHKSYNTIEGKLQWYGTIKLIFKSVLKPSLPLIIPCFIYRGFGTSQFLDPFPVNCRNKIEFGSLWKKIIFNDRTGISSAAKERKILAII